MRALVETVGSHLFMHPKTREVVEAFRPCVIVHDDLINQQVVLKSMRILAHNLPDIATDAAWMEWLKNCDGDMELAVSSFVSQYVEEEHAVLDLDKPQKVLTPKGKNAG